MPSNDSRSALAQALKRALEGEPQGALLKNEIGSLRNLSQLEKSAWLQLQNWAADESLRKQFPSHADFSRRRLSDLLDSLDR